MDAFDLSASDARHRYTSYQLIGNFQNETTKLESDDFPVARIAKILVKVVINEL